MKKAISASLFSALAFWPLYAPAAALPTPFVGPLTISWTCTSTNLFDAPQYSGEGKTNITGTGSAKTTNVTQIYRYSTSISPLETAGFLGLLENSLSNTFPAGSRLVYVSGGGTTNSVFVTDKSGTNSIADISAIFAVGSTNDVSTGSDTTVQKTTKNSLTSSSASGLRSGNQAIILKYDDSDKTTKDGTTTSFKFVGKSTYSRSGSSTTSTNGIITEKVSETFTVTGIGYGTIRGKACLLEGSITGSAAGTETRKVEDSDN
jgi:hypothetical protein